MGSISKREKFDGDDIISTFHEAILLYILSLLPTEDAVRTSVLSKRWRYLWRGITNLDFDDDYQPTRVSRFPSFVSQVLRHCDSPRVQKFRLHTSIVVKGGHSDVSPSWGSGCISEAIRRNVRELDIRLYELDLPLCFFTCKTLTVLEMFVGDDMKSKNIPTSFSIPSLKILKLCLYFPKHDFVQKLIGSCPKLEDLYMKGEPWSDRGVIFNLNSPALRRLYMHLHLPYFKDWCQQFLIDMPRLVCLRVDGRSLAKYLVKNLSSLVEANVSIWGEFTNEDAKDHANRVPWLLRGIRAVKSLSLGADTMIALHFANNDHLPTFHNLTRLEVHIIDYHGWKILPDLLGRSPNLEVFIVNQELEDEWVADSIWREPVSVPACLLQHLEVIKIAGFQGDICELELVKYLLGNAKVLKILTIKSPGLALRKEVKVGLQVMKFPRGSRRCEVEFLGDFFSKFRKVSCRCSF